MKIFFCDLCNESVPQGDLDEGRAFLRKGRVVCATCDRLMTASEGPEGAGEPFVTAAGGGTATLTRPATSAATAASAAGPAMSGPPRELARSEPAPSSGSTGGWLALVTLVFSAAAFALLVERMTAVESSMLQEDRALADDVRYLTDELDANLAGLGARNHELELRLAERLDDARLRTDEHLRGMSQELADARAEASRLNQTVARLEAELAQARVELVRRDDETAGRVARAEEDLGYYSQRLSDLEMASLRPLGVGAAAPAEGEAGGAPAWQGLLADLASPLAGTRWQAVDALGQTGDPSVVEHLIPVLKDPDVFVRMAGARALEKLGATTAVPALIDALEDPEAAVREAAIVALQELTGRDFRFDPLANEADRAKRVKAWRDWWEKEGQQDG